MAQVLAVPGDVRHGFSYVGQFNHYFGRITGIAATVNGNIVLCDYDKKNLILLYPLGKFLKKLNVDSEPYDIAIMSQNIGYITQPKSRSALQIDPDRMVELFQVTCNELNTTVLCVSAARNTGRDYSPTMQTCPCYFGVNNDGDVNVGSANYQQISRTITSISKNGHNIGSRVVKFHTVNTDSFLFCIVGQNYIRYNFFVGYPINQNQRMIYNFATMDTPTGICSDDYGHIYVSGQGSNNIHRLISESKSMKIKDSRGLTIDRLEQDYKVLDIPLESQHGIKEPVALCFNQDHSKMYIVNEWGKSVLVFDVI